MLDMRELEAEKQRADGAAGVCDVLAGSAVHEHVDAPCVPEVEGVAQAEAIAGRRAFFVKLKLLSVS
jgi:hypothetical protein